MERIAKAKQFFSEARQELKKVTWPTKEQTISSTWVVLGVVFFIAIYLGIIDLILAKLVGYILS